MSLPAWLAAALELAKPLQRRFEGFRSRPYLCPAAVATIAYGATQYEDGRKVTLADPPVTRERGEALLDHDSAVFIRAAAALSPSLKHSPERLAAIGDFCFNLGTTRYKASTLRRKVDAGEWGEAVEQLEKWVFGGGRRLPGLVDRRKAEGALILKSIKAAMAAPATSPAGPLTAADLAALITQARSNDNADPIGELLRLLQARAA